jgi:hypothetical protein
MTDLINELRAQLAAVTAEQGIAQEVLRVTKNALERLTAERDAERTARKALEEAGKAVMTFLDTPLSPDTMPDPALAVAMLGSALAIAAKLPA